MNHKDNFSFPSFSMTCGIPLDLANDVPLADRGETVPPAAAVLSAPPVSDIIHSYSSQRSPQGETGFGPSFSRRNIVEQYTDAIDVEDESSLHARNSQHIGHSAIPESIPPASCQGSTWGAGTHDNELEAISGDSPLSQQLVFESQSKQDYGRLQCDSTRVNLTLANQRLPDQLIISSEDIRHESSALTHRKNTYQQLNSRVVHAGRKKVPCTFPGCLKMIRKDGLSRHVNETHFRVVKGVCAHCGKTFQRPYLKRKHEITCTSSN